MNTETRLLLDMLSRVLGFCRAHPSDDAGTQGLVARLDERLTRAKVLNEQAVSGHLTAHASVMSKDDLKITIRDDFRVLKALVAVVVMDDPTFTVGFEIPNIHVSHWAFLADARVALTHAEALRDKFAAHGIKSTFLEDLAAQMDRYEKAVDTKLAATSAHIGAHADLDAVISECQVVVNLLDKVNKTHFRENAELLGAWKSARDVAWPTTSKEEPPPSGGGDAVEPAA